MPKLIDLTGKRFGSLTVISRAPDKKRNRYWFCVCDCGDKKAIAGAALARGATVSCGKWCHQTTHGHTKDGKKSPEYATWLSMKQRCLNKNSTAARHYSERGITICNEWINSFDAFFRDMGEKPSKDHSIDRINNNGPYCPENCRWATRQEQMKNTRGCRLVTIEGKTQDVASWCDELGISKSMVRSRIYLGWDPAKAITEPKRPGGRKRIEK